MLKKKHFVSLIGIKNFEKIEKIELKKNWHCPITNFYAAF